MKILHLPVGFLPWMVGGREVYCHSLCRGLERLGIQNVVAVHQRPGGPEIPGAHGHDGVVVRVLPPLPESDRRLQWYARRYPALPGFDALIAELRPDVVHFHDQNSGASLSHLEAVKARGIPTVVTCHSPGQTCSQTELLRLGRIPCDGEVRLGRCTACRLTFAGVPRPVAAALSVAEWPGVDAESRRAIARTLSARRMTRIFRDALDGFIVQADAVVVLADWSREVWLRNGCPPEKLRLVRTGAPRPPAARSAASPVRPAGPLRVACIGRCDRTKGFHLLVEAVRSRPDLAVEVHWLGPYWESEYGARLRRRIEDDPRFLAPRLVDHRELPNVLAGMDVVAIPSVWLETGPLVLFEALAAGVPVVASRLGGLAETVREGRNGWLFPPGDAGALARILADLAEQPAQLAALRAGLNRPDGPPLRTFDDIARDMALIYRDLVRPSSL